MSPCMYCTAWAGRENYLLTETQKNEKSAINLGSDRPTSLRHRCSIPYCTIISTALYCTVLYCTVPYCTTIITVLYCAVHYTSSNALHVPALSSTNIVSKVVASSRHFILKSAF